MAAEKKHVCPVAIAGGLDIGIRRWLHDPRKMLGPYIQEGMTVLDVGCGPGFFSVELARMVGSSGRVIAADLQAGMLQKLRQKIQGSELQERITLHQCAKNRLGLSEKVDFILAFYMVHEIPDQEGFFAELRSILKPDGRVFIVEPPLHTSRKAFESSIQKARDAGFMAVARPRLFLDKAVILQSA